MYMYVMRQGGPIIMNLLVGNTTKQRFFIAILRDKYVKILQGFPNKIVDCL